MANGSGLKDIILVVTVGSAVVGLYDILTRKRSIQEALIRQTKLENALATVQDKLDALHAKIG